MIEDAKKPFVACEKFTEFHEAEDKHQKNALKRHPGSQIHILQIEVESTIQHPRRNMAVDEMVHIYRFVPVSELGGECDLLPRGHEAQRLRVGSRLHGRLQQGVEAAGPQHQDRRVRQERHHQEGLTQLIDIIVMMRM